MQFGFALPTTTNGDELCRFARAVERLGYESVWAPDHIVLPIEPTDQYPYTEDGSFTRASSSPVLETMTTLSYVAACTSRIKIGSTVIIVPYRNPILQAKMFASLDVLSGGRAVCGVGVGWWEEEFDALGASHKDRGPVTDEYLEIFKLLWTEDKPEFHGRFYDFDGIQMYPKPLQKPHIPIWVGGHTRRALRRTAKYGNAWHPTRQTPDYVAEHLPYLREQTEAAGRNPDDITISLKRSLHFTDLGIADSNTVRSGGAVFESTQGVIDDVKYCGERGIQQLTYDFRTSDVDACISIMEHFAEKVVPAVG